MKKNWKPIIWRLCCLSVAALSILSFTPVVIPSGIIEPTIGNLPRTLWSGIIIAFAILALTLVGMFVHPDGFPHPADEQ